MLLNKLSNQTDIVVGTPTVGRHHADLEGLVGMFVNTLALRNKADSNLSFRDFLANVKQNTLKAFDNQLYQYEELVDTLEIPRGTGHNPLFDVLIKKGHQCHVISPNEYPSFLGWLPDQEKILRYSENTNECNLLIQICIQFLLRNFQLEKGLLYSFMSNS